MRGLSSPSVNLQMTLNWEACISLLEGRKALKDLDRLDQRLALIKKSKSWVLHLSLYSPLQHYRAQAEWLESCLSEKDLGSLVDSCLSAVISGGQEDKKHPGLNQEQSGQQE